MSNLWVIEKNLELSKCKEYVCYYEYDYYIFTINNGDLLSNINSQENCFMTWKKFYVDDDINAIVFKCFKFQTKLTVDDNLMSLIKI